MPHLIAITGGSGSGKSTLAEALLDALPPGRALLLREDWYYADAGALPDFDPLTFDFDDVAARDHGLLAAHLRALKAGRTVEAPDYDFVTHRRRTPGHTITPAEVIVLEGTHCLATPEVADLFDLKVFVDTPADIRFIRRLLRDQAERGRTADSVIAQYLKTVRPGHERFTEPSRALADFIVADATAAVRLEDAGAVRRLLAPVLAHPLFDVAVTPYCAAPGRD
jgi:uridine kinase